MQTGGDRVRRDLDQIEPGLLRHGQSGADFGDAVVGAVLVDELDLADADLLVDARPLLGGGLRGSDRATNGCLSPLSLRRTVAIAMRAQVGARIRDAHRRSQKIGSFSLQVNDNAAARRLRASTICGETWRRKRCSTPACRIRTGSVMNDNSLKFLEIGAGAERRAHCGARAGRRRARAVLARRLQVRHEGHQGAGAGAIGREQAGRACVRFDYSGHGESGGAFTDGTIGRWLADSLAVFDACCRGPQIVVGSSMGGWLALLLVARAARARGTPAPASVAGLVLIAPAVDFTEELMWKRFTPEIKRELEEKGVWARPSQYAAEPYLVTRQLIEEGRNHLLLGGMIETGCPVRILQGVEDPDVPWQHAVELSSRLASDDVVLTLVKDGDHRLSRPEDIERLIARGGGILARRLRLHSRSRQRKPAADSKFTPSWSPLRQTTRQARRVRPCSNVNSNVSGMPNVFASFRQAPPPLRSCTVQEMTDESRGTMILALRNTRVRWRSRRSSSMTHPARQRTREVARTTFRRCTSQTLPNVERQDRPNVNGAECRR